jgi:putative DNA primase/helicase
MPTDLALNLTAHGIRLRHHRPGEHRTACPQCAQVKSRRQDDALAVRFDPDGSMVCYCHRCNWRARTGGQERAPGRDRTPSRPAMPPEPSKRSTGLPGAAAGLWRASRRVLLGTIAAAYLEGRNCALPHPNGDLRFHAELRHPSGHVGPGLVALVSDAVTGAPLTLHRTWLKADGSGKAELDRSRLLWPGLPAKGGVIRLWPDEEVTLGLCVAEGIETALSAALGFGLAWSTIDANNLQDLPVLGGIEALTIVADHDAHGRGFVAADACARRWLEAGQEARVWPAPTVGTDFNDLVRGVA